MNSLNVSNQRAITSLLTLYLLVSPADSLGPVVNILAIFSNANIF